MDTGAATSAVKVSGPADIVALLPHHIGFHPAESVVVVCLEGRRHRMGLVMRHDLVPAAEEAALVELMSAHFRRNGADNAMVVIYTDEKVRRDDLPRRAFVDALTDALRAADVVESILVSEGRWWSYHCAAPCCPADGTPLPDRLGGAAAAVAAEHVLRGKVLLDDRASLVASIRPPRNVIADEARRQAFERAEEDFFAECSSRGFEKARTRTLELLRRRNADWSQGSQELPLSDAARIVVGLRDALAHVEAAVLALDEESESYPALLTALCRQTDDPDAAPVCTLLGWVAYLRGRGGVANVAVDRALSCDPGYEMARFLETSLGHQVPPATVRDILQQTKQHFDQKNGDPRAPRDAF